MPQMARAHVLRFSGFAICRIAQRGGSPYIECITSTAITSPDPHTPMASLFWSHMGWVLYHNRDHDSLTSFERYARDLLKDPFYLKLERRGLWSRYFGCMRPSSWLWVDCTAWPRLVRVVLSKWLPAGWFGVFLCGLLLFCMGHGA